MPLRILLALVLVVFVLGVGAIIVFAGMSTESVALRILLGVIFVALFGGLTWKICKVFKKKTGLTPKEYKKLYNAKNSYMLIDS